MRSTVLVLLFVVLVAFEIKDHALSRVANAAVGHYTL